MLGILDLGVLDSVRRLTRGLVVAVVAALVVVSSGSLGVAAKQGEPAPAFDLPNAAGTTTSLKSLEGKVVLLNFWATWCKPCVRELPELEALHQRVRGAGCVVVAISIDSETAKAKALRAHLKLTMPVLFDPKGESAGAYEPPAMPTSYLIDARGVIQAVYAKALDKPTIAAIAARMKALSPRSPSEKPEPLE